MLRLHRVLTIQATQQLERGLCGRTTLESEIVIISIILELKFPAALNIFAPEGRNNMNKQTFLRCQINDYARVCAEAIFRRA